MPVVVRYPGRACLLGEHCDWAGGASLAVPVPLWIEVEGEEALEGEGHRAISDLDGALLEGRWPREGAVLLAGGPLRFVPATAWELRRRDIPVRPARLEVRSTLPPARGLSSSAAFCLAAADALARVSGRSLDANELADIAYTVEHDLLGVDCGRLDPMACAAARPIFIRWHNGIAHPEAVDPLGTFHLVVATFDAPRDTAGILATLNRHARGDSGDPADCAAVRDALTDFARLAAAGARALAAGDAPALGSAMNQAQAVYESNFHARLPALRAPRLVATCAALRANGALGAKFSGAGGDGSAVALFPDAASAEAASSSLCTGGTRAWYAPVYRP